jgi:carboxyl-terminal processing protease
MLLKPGDQVFSTRGRTADSFQDYRAARDGLRFDGPVVVLVNRGSASAAEIVSGAVQDHDRGLIVGETTFGKGVVQTIYPVKDAGLALTTAKYYTPSGRSIQRDFDSFFAYTHPDAGEPPAEGGEVAPPPPAVRTPLDEREVFLTDSGRKVFGGGGIVPDHEVELGEYSTRVARLLGSSAFFHFAVSYLADVPDKAVAARQFAPSEEALARFRDRVVKEKWLPEADIDAALADPEDREDIAVNLRTEILNAGASPREGFRAFISTDTQINTALDLFDEAAKLQARARSPRSDLLARR